MEESLGCWFNEVFIACDGCDYGNDAIRCADFRKAFWAKLGHEKKSVDTKKDSWRWY